MLELLIFSLHRIDNKMIQNGVTVALYGNINDTVGQMTCNSKVVTK